jgi:hypothetical protein
MAIRLLTFVRDYAVPCKRFHKLACRLQGRPFEAMSAPLQAARDRLNRLNETRREAQRQAIALCAHVDICRQCEGRCCRGDYNHFTAIDYLTRLFTESPIQDYGRNLRARPLRRMLWEKLRALVLRGDEYDCNKPTQPAAMAHARCPELTEKGCRFAPEDRPIRCVMWTCPTFRKDLKGADFTQFGACIRRLGNVCDEVSRIVRDAASFTPKAERRRLPSAIQK